MLKSLRIWAIIAAMLAPCVALAQGSNTVIPLLVNASATGNLFAGTLGGNYQINLAGTVGGSTVTVTASDSSGVQQTVATFTAVGTQCIALGARANLQAVVTGGSPSGLYLNASGVQYCPNSGSGGPSTNVNIAGINSTAPGLTNPLFTAFAEAGDTTGTFTNATQTTSVTASNGDGYGTALVSINGTYATATGVFEESDDNGTTWYSVVATRSDNSAPGETGYTTLTNTNRQWIIALSGNDSIRVRSTAVATGTVNVRISIVAAPNATTVNGTVNTVSGVITPAAGTTSTVVTGGTAVTLVTGPIKGGYITNPINLASQGIAAAENAYIDPVGSPGSTDTAGNGTTVILTPGQTYSLPALSTGVLVKGNAATSGHKFTVVVW